MGFGGFGIAIAAVFLLVYLVPQALRSRQVLGDAPIDERFAEDLRLVTRPSLTPTTPQQPHGKIFLTERIMEPTMTSEQLRKAARERSRVRARMANRRANQLRGMMIAAVLVLVTLASWGAVTFASVSSIVAIGATALTGAYVAGFGYVLNVMAQANDADGARIVRLNKVLRGRVVPVEKPARPVAPVEKQVAVQEVPDIDVERSVDAPVAEPAAPRKMSREEREARAAALAIPAKPSYTLKTVAPFVPKAETGGDAPFRPTRLNQRLGDESMPAAHVAPEMTGNEELRQDLLGSGSTLDALLSRRRA